MFLHRKRKSCNGLLTRTAAKNGTFTIQTRTEYDKMSMVYPKPTMIYPCAALDKEQIFVTDKLHKSYNLAPCPRNVAQTFHRKISSNKIVANALN